MNDPVVVIDPLGPDRRAQSGSRRLVGRPYSERPRRDAAAAFAHWSTLVQLLEEVTADDEVSLRDRRPRSDQPDRHSTPGSRGSAKRSAPPAGSSSSAMSPIGKRAAEERVRMLREQAARAEAEAANRAKDRFLATLSHELRTPLTPVLATVTAMLDDPETPESLRSVLEMIRRNVVLEARLIDDLLDLSRIRRGTLHLKREVVDAHELVHHVIDICRDDLRQRAARLTVDLAASGHHVDADPIRFQQVLWNLIKNAIKFTPPGGQVTIASRDSRWTRQRCRQPAPASSSRSATPASASTPTSLPRIFDVPEQGGISATRRFGGLGLGLTISRSIVEQHGGRLTVTSPAPAKEPPAPSRCRRCPHRNRAPAALYSKDDSPGIAREAGRCGSSSSTTMPTP